VSAPRIFLFLTSWPGQSSSCTLPWHPYITCRVSMEKADSQAHESRILTDPPALPLF
jgi:hypothetical protein